MINLDVPARIAALPRDGRGYPVPFIVLYDAEGKATFSANDMSLVWQAADENLCHICGQALEPYPWFVGGPGSALLNGAHGAYTDGPMHHECMTFALAVCPHLTQQMTRALGPAVQARLRAQGLYHVFDNTEMPGTPQVFLGVSAWHYELTHPRRYYTDTPTWIVRKPYRKTEYWQAGAMMPRDEGERAAKAAARKLAQELKR